MISHWFVVTNPVNHPKPAGEAHEHKEQKVIGSNLDTRNEVVQLHSLHGLRPHGTLVRMTTGTIVPVVSVVAMIMTVVYTTAISAATAIHKYSAHTKHCIYSSGFK
jgi:hypothetical protein